MENDLISRSALLSELQSYKEDLSLVFESLEQGVEKRICSAEICGVLDAIIQVKNAPAVEAVEVVRCKDCEHFFSEVCRHGFALKYCRGDEFCSYGERRAEDGN